MYDGDLIKRDIYSLLIYLRNNKSHVRSMNISNEIYSIGLTEHIMKYNDGMNCEVIEYSLNISNEIVYKPGVLPPPQIMDQMFVIDALFEIISLSSELGFGG